jgi:diguanylate cyclase (GGDEF)-like protein
VTVTVNFDVEPTRGPEQGPASRAAKRQASGAGERGYPPPDDVDDPTGDAVALAATRALLKASTREEVARVLHTAVGDLGGTVVPARLASESAMSVDVSLGVGEPQVVVVLDPMDLASLRLTHHLPTLVEDALAVAARCDHHQRQAARASKDSLTGVASRGAIGPRLGLTMPGDVICMLDVDGLQELNDTRGHEAGDQVLRALGKMLGDAVRGADFVGRYGSDEFILIFSATSVPVALERARHLAASWILGISHRTSVSIGVAPVGEDGVVSARNAAVQALRRAKELGGDRVELAISDDYADNGQASS